MFILSKISQKINFFASSVIVAQKDSTYLMQITMETCTEFGKKSKYDYSKYEVA